MSRNGSMSSALTLKKWLPQEGDDVVLCFAQCSNLRKISIQFAENLVEFLNGKQFENYQLRKSSSKSENLIDKLEQVLTDLEKLEQNYGQCYYSLSKHKKNGPLIKIKTKIWQDELTLEKQKVTYYLQDLIAKIAHLYIHHDQKFLTLTFKISNVFNSMLHYDTQYELTDSIQITNNTCTYLQHPQRKISITRLLQMLVLNRAEQCAHKLIDCLLETYKLYESHCDGNGDESDNSSLEIYKALTNHMSPEELQELKQNDKNFDLDEEEQIAREILSGYQCDHFRNLEKLIECEEQYVLDLLQAAIESAPNMLGNDGIKQPKDGGEKHISPKALQKVLDYYQEILWGEVGNFLEHIILWWGPSPLASRVPHSSQHLREWITQFTPTAQIPPFIISTLTSLADGLGVHVTSCSWDRHFRLSLVHSIVRNDPQTGQLFSEMLQDLVSLCNQCEVTNEWVVGAPLEELPLVEQIPILHRLDHSVHTTRLWAATETKKLANSWNVASFFRITHCDIINCLSQLSNVRMVDHTLAIDKGGLEVHVEVCAKMRQKLVSEVNTNIQKLKETSAECVACLASVCTTTSLAHLQMIFPKNSYWHRRGDLPSTHSPYVFRYLEQILTPVLRATDDVVICNMILRLMCEAWLDHIYNRRVHFSQCGAMQLLADFAGVAEWLTENKELNDHIRLKMLKNEVLRRCEGVGRLLLRNPGEKIKMSEKQQYKDTHSSPKSDTKELMPAEMYVPNQEQWLDLRAGKRRFLLLHPPCCS